MEGEEKKKKYSCSYCEYETQWWTNIKTHERLHTGDKPYKCKICNKSFASNSYYRKHARLHDGYRPYSCNICDEAFLHKIHLNRHEKCHIKIEKEIHSCSFCGFIASNRDSLRGHERKHTQEKPFSCEFCDKTFHSKSQMKVHERIHTGERPYACLKCDKAFVTSSHLSKHVKTHSGEKSYKCDICNKAFTSQWYMKTHKKSHAREEEQSLTSKDIQYISYDEQLIERKPDDQIVIKENDLSIKEECVEIKYNVGGEYENTAKDPLSLNRNEGSQLIKSEVIKEDIDTCIKDEFLDIKEECVDIRDITDNQNNIDIHQNNEIFTGDPLMLDVEENDPLTDCLET
eukprot:TRINITY_DN12576_c0_g1_i3.p1 TRINITY_DN12576_c0_g1~~TRINITY_DN12576_c0_g1_i3.p1  ORF type:complete len:353 (-),score=3.78 TRINITY_DN12576_c0_g1_i3:171-1202(-)